MNATNQHYLSELKNFFADAHICRASSRLVEHLSIRLAALGEAAEVLAIVRESPEAESFIPLVEGLRLHLGHPTCVDSDAAREIAAQIHRASSGSAFDAESASLAA